MLAKPCRCHCRIRKTIPRGDIPEAIGLKQSGISHGREQSKVKINGAFSMGLRVNHTLSLLDIMSKEVAQHTILNA
jgi:hypothetical protein